MEHDEKLIFLLTNALEEALEVSSDQIASIDTFNHSFDADASVELDFEDACFMHEYYNGKRLSVSLEVEGEMVVLRIFVGEGCKNPRLADEFIDRYLQTTRYAGIWSVPQSSAENCSLMLETRFRCNSQDVLISELVDRLSLFSYERFTNELRPFIHYFE